MTQTEAMKIRGNGFALGLAWLVLGAMPAQARQEVLRWTHPDASAVQRFEALVGSSSGVYGAPVNLAKPVPDGSGIYQGTITVGDTADVYVVVRAVGTTGEVSANSGERFRAAPAGSGGGAGSAPSFDFEGVAAGSVVPGWTDTGANYALTADDSLFGISAGALGSFSTSSTASHIHSHMANPAPTQSQNYRLRGRMSLGSSSGGLGVTVYSRYPSADAYYRLGSAPGGTFTLSARHGLSCALSNSGYTPAPGGSYAFDIAIQTLSDRNRIHAKVWTRGGTEPTTPQIVCDDTNAARPTRGTFGTWATGSGSKSWDDFQLTPLSGSLSAPPVVGEGPPAPPVLIDIVPVQ